MAAQEFWHQDPFPLSAAAPGDDRRDDLAVAAAATAAFGMYAATINVVPLPQPAVSTGRVGTIEAFVRYADGPQLKTVTDSPAAGTMCGEEVR